MNENWLIVRSAASALQHGATNLADFPKYLRRLLVEDAWRAYTLPNGTPVGPFVRFSEFAASVVGLGSDMETIRRIVSKDRKLSDMLTDAERVGRGSVGRGRPSIGEGESPSPISDDQTGKASARLARDHPDQYDEVVNHRTSVNAAAIAAGIRPRRVSVRTDSATSAASTLYRQMAPGTLRALIDELNALTGEGRS